MSMVSTLRVDNLVIITGPVTFLELTRARYQTAFNMYTTKSKTPTKVNYLIEVEFILLTTAAFQATCVIIMR